MASFVSKGKYCLSILSSLIWICAFFSESNLCAAASRQRNFESENAIAMRALRDTVDVIRHEMNNHESEIRMFDERLQNFEVMLDSIRDQFAESSKSHKEQLKGNSANFEAKINALEATSKGLIADLKQFKSYTNESTSALTQYKQKLGELEKIIDQQSQNIDHLQAAMHSLMDALQVKSGAEKSSPDISVESSSGRSYRIKAGDSLEKIARIHETTVQALKEKNGLTSDRIVVGKLLLIPEKL